VLVLANGLAGNAEVRSQNSEFRIFQSALNHVCLELQKMIVRDGRRRSCVVTVRVNDAKTVRTPMLLARPWAKQRAGENKLARRRSNWGRIIDALGIRRENCRGKVDIGYSSSGGKKILGV